MAATVNREIALPVKTNTLGVDVTNIISALQKIDAELQSLVGATANIISAESPEFLGIPTAPTAASDNNSQQLASTQFVQSVVGNIGGHPAQEDNPHNVTKAQIGLGNVENTPDVDKVISTAVQSALDALPVITVVTSVPADGVGKDGDVFLIVDP